jgi:2OG-Fe(II) oxygenase superfamily
MNLRFLVIDNFLTPELFAEACAAAKREHYGTVQSAVDPLRDGESSRSRGGVFRHDRGSLVASGVPIAQVCAAIEERSSLFGTPGIDWTTTTYTYWRYPPGSRLGWHNDAGGGRVGEFILYLHPEWKPSWGGELLILDEECRYAGTRTPAELETYVLGQGALLKAVVPVPNRLVLMQANTAHCVSRVDRSAGDCVRTSLSGFVSRQFRPNSADRHSKVLKVLGLEETKSE